MNSAAATFWVQETGYPVRALTQHMHQNTDERGREVSRPVSGELRLVLDVRPHDVLLPTWAYAEHKPLAARVVFAPLDGLSNSLMLTLDDAHCVSYEEHFETNPGGQQASHYCILNVVARRITKHGVEYLNHWPDGPAQ